MGTSKKNTDTAIDALQKADLADAVTSGGEATAAFASAEAQGAVSRDEFDRLKTDRDQLFDRLARLQAEFENARKREARERTDSREAAVAKTVEQFLPVLDNFQLALGSAGSIEQLRAGVELIVKQMEEVLRSLQVQPIEAAGAKFDPRVHDAIENVECNDMPDRQVLDEVRRGYRIRDRLLRPALVRVVNNPQQKES